MDAGTVVCVRFMCIIKLVACSSGWITCLHGRYHHRVGIEEVVLVYLRVYETVHSLVLLKGLYVGCWAE